MAKGDIRRFKHVKDACKISGRLNGEQHITTLEYFYLLAQEIDFLGYVAKEMFRRLILDREKTSAADDRIEFSHPELPGSDAV